MYIADHVLYILFFICGISPLILGYIFGVVGLQIYVALCVVLSNIQVLKATSISFLPNPIAMGTILFSSTFLVTDILVEIYGIYYAKKTIALGFCAGLLSVLIMTLTLYSPTVNSNIFFISEFGKVNTAMEVLFTPTPRILVASLIAYIISQLNDVWIFYIFKKKTGIKFLWLRANLSTIFSSILDNVIFSLFAWVILTPTPLSWKTVIFTYILGSMTIRVSLSILNTFFLYCARIILKKI